MSGAVEEELPVGLQVDYGREVALTRNPNPGIHVAEVRGVTRLTPTMVRVHLGGDDVAGFTWVGPDQRVKVFLPADGVVWETEPPTDVVPWALPPGVIRPRHRTYTVRNLVPAEGSFDLDVAVHDGGVGSAWAVQAAAGQRISFIGPVARWSLRPEVTRLVLVADESGLPAVASILAWLPATVRAEVFVEVPGRSSRQPLPSAAPTEVHWFHTDEAASTGAGSVSAQVVAAVAALKLAPGTTQVWGGAEQATIRAVRRHLLADRGFTRGEVYLVAYWRRGVVEDEAFVDPRQHHD